MRTRAFCVRYKGLAVQSELWTGVTSIGPSSHWSDVKCASIVTGSGNSDSDSDLFVHWLCNMVFFLYERLRYFEVWLIGFT